MLLFSCDNNIGHYRASKVTHADVDGCKLVEIKGCKVLICKSKEGINDYAVGYSGMVKDDCNCRFKD